MPNLERTNLDGITVKVLPDGTISILIFHKRLSETLKELTKLTRDKTHAVAKKRTSPHSDGYTHFPPELTGQRG